jgi:hypothetical protein
MQCMGLAYHGNVVQPKPASRACVSEIESTDTQAESRQQKLSCPCSTSSSAFFRDIIAAHPPLGLTKQADRDYHRSSSSRTY